jgi:glycosyltransferase involved in cell wall biosynthesis
MSDEPVSVIVPTRNSAPHIAACLESVRAQTYSPLELIVVDNQSEDATLAIAEGIADHVIVAGPERSAQRNEGARQGTGDYLLFIDSDMILEPEVVAQAVALTERGAGSVIIPETSFGEGFWARCKILERSCYVGDDSIEAARFFPRERFDSVGGFDEEMPAGPEDWDLHQRVRALGVPVARTEAFIHHDEGHPSLRQLIAKKFYYGRGMSSYIDRHPSDARRQLRVVRPAFVRHWRRLAKSPLTAGGMLVMKACEFGAGATGLVTQSVQTRLARDERN